MLKAYEVIIKNGQLTWLEGQPPILSARAVVTILEEMPIIDQENLYDLSKSEHILSARESAKILIDMGGSEPDLQPIPRRRFPVPSLAGKAKTLGDIVSPIIDETDWECLK